MGIIDLENKDILQINATIIAGALIFVTIYSLPLSGTVISNRISAVALGIGVVMLFSQSSYFVISGKRPAGISTMKTGLTYLFIMSIIYMGSIIWPAIQQVNQSLSNVLKSLTNPSAPVFSNKSVHHILNNTLSAPQNITIRNK